MTHLQFPVRSTAALALFGLLAVTGCDRQDAISDKRINTPTQKTTVSTVAASASQAAQATPIAAAIPAVEAPKKGTPTPTAATKPAIKRLVIASDVKEHEPVVLDSATVEQPIVAFLEFQNPKGGEFAVVVTFEHESGERVGFIELSVPAEMTRFRTWGRTRNIKRTGSWTAIVKDDAGEELARQQFTVS